MATQGTNVIPQGGVTMEQIPLPYRDAVMGAAQQYGVPWQLLANVLQRESGWNPNQVGPVTSTGERAIGLGQFMPRTARDYGVTNDPTSQIYGAARLLRENSGGVRGPDGLMGGLDWAQAVIRYSGVRSRWTDYYDSGFDPAVLDPTSREYLDHTLRGVVPREQMPQLFQDADRLYGTGPETPERRNYIRGNRSELGESDPGTITNVIPGDPTRQAQTNAWATELAQMNRWDWRPAVDPGTLPPPPPPTVERDSGAPQNTTIGELFPDWLGGAQQRVMGTPGWMRPPGTEPQPGDPDYVEPSDPHAGMIYLPGHGWVGQAYAAALIAAGPGITHFPGSGPYGSGNPVTVNDPPYVPPVPPAPSPIGPVEIAPGGSGGGGSGGGDVFSPSSGGVPIGPFDGPAGGGQGGSSGGPVTPSFPSDTPMASMPRPDAPASMAGSIGGSHDTAGAMAVSAPGVQPFFGELPPPPPDMRDAIAQYLAYTGGQMPQGGMPLALS